jgi:predicted transcriptional regulator
MKKLMLLAIGTAAVVQAAKYLGINSMEDLRKMLAPKIKELLHV